MVRRDGAAAEPLTQAPPGLKVRFLERPGVAGPTAKRNVGWRATAAPLVAFTDDDCRAHPSWLESLLAAPNGGGTFMQGRTEPDPDERHLLHGFPRSQEIRGPGGWDENSHKAHPPQPPERPRRFDQSPPFRGEGTSPRDPAY